MPTIFAPETDFDRPSLLYLSLSQPVRTLLRLFDLTSSVILYTRPSKVRSSHALPVRIVCISDTHTLQCSVPDGDVLIHAGDLTNKGTPAELQAQIDWLDSLPHKYKIAIAGNHDSWLDARCRHLLGADGDGEVDWKGVKYLQHASTMLRFTGEAQGDGAAAAEGGGGRTVERKLTVFGAPQIPACGGDDFAFQYQRGDDAWTGTVPDDTDILITHTPPRFHLDLPSAHNGEGLGCGFLLGECWRVRPRAHVFGHVHAGRTETFGRWTGGKQVVRWDPRQKVVERALARSAGNGLLRSMFDLRCWVDCFRIVWLGVSGLIWDKVWGGEVQRETLMVNAALMFEDSGKLGNEPQVFEI
ncbi:Metallo-dependent phosphatase [Polychaeton citri CBS 116435]|uniref:Metallo-dependent phosphatase n=1 Tax=Polychaeton citri CBS 116435 TaxID=1314669 RepID=A0A9P4QF87_9PEZI|nr:Metallo-dependent phosphatase [Polychaeton citri CBS 116435]